MLTSLRLLSLILFVIPLIVPAIASGQKAEPELPTIIAVRTPVIDLWAKASATGEVREINKADIPLPLKVQAVSENLMLLVKIAGQKGWVFSHQVKTDTKPKMTSRCIGEDRVQVGATRAIGEDCPTK